MRGKRRCLPSQNGFAIADVIDPLAWVGHVVVDQRCLTTTWLESLAYLGVIGKCLRTTVPLGSSPQASIDATRAAPRTIAPF
ncbi:hypothetical protein RhiJN_23766 [Ceratobasidium sp. AG-Ba]|nr:hypothetical protein RhiJN_23766 [Ceratobasidium sp. AG-Ba]